MVNVVIARPRTIQVSSNSTSGVIDSANVVIARPRTIQVSSNFTSGVIDSATHVTIKNLNIYFANRLDLLSDVDLW